MPFAMRFGNMDTALDMGTSETVERKQTMTEIRHRKPDSTTSRTSTHQSLGRGSPDVAVSAYL